ncbi:hypothetical protein JMUB6875_65350 [Nocardia sp. JMUB6875]
MSLRSELASTKSRVFISVLIGVRANRGTWRLTSREALDRFVLRIIWAVPGHDCAQGNPSIVPDPATPLVIGPYVRLLARVSADAISETRGG